MKEKLQNEYENAKRDYQNANLTVFHWVIEQSGLCLPG